VEKTRPKGVSVHGDAEARITATQDSPAVVPLTCSSSSSQQCTFPHEIEDVGVSVCASHILQYGFFASSCPSAYNFRRSAVSARVPAPMGASARHPVSGNTVGQNIGKVQGEACAES